MLFIFLNQIIRAKLYKNVEGVSWAVAASVQSWRTKEFAEDIFPLAVNLINDKSRDLGGILPAVAEGLVIGLTRGVSTNVQLRLIEGIFDFLKRDEHADTDVTDGVSLKVAAACVRDVASDTARVGKVLDRLVSLALGIIGTVSSFSRLTGAEVIVHCLWLFASVSIPAIYAFLSFSHFPQTPSAPSSSSLCVA